MFIWSYDASYPRKLCFSAVTPRQVWWDLVTYKHLHFFVPTHFSDTQDESCVPCTLFKGLFMCYWKGARTLGGLPFVATSPHAGSPSPSPPWARRGGGSCREELAKEQSWQNSCSCHSSWNWWILITSSEYLCSFNVGPSLCLLAVRSNCFCLCFPISPFPS